jgi:glycosyltransferase involved in cell wall biosynthesis
MSKNLLPINRDMHLAIDATNIISGGGLTHLSKLLEKYSPGLTGIKKVTIWSNETTAHALPNYSWLIKKTPFWASGSLLVRFFSQQFFLVSNIKKEGCHVLFSPGGTIPFRCSLPVITMSQNMLPFQKSEANHFGKWSFMRIKMWLLQHAQGQSFKRANGVIFLTNYADKFISDFLKIDFDQKVTIPHGVESRFFQKPRSQRPISSYRSQEPFRLMYVSILMPYKHQCEVASAVKVLHDKGFNIEVRFIGADWGWYGSKFLSLIKSLDPCRDFLLWSGFESFEKLHNSYKNCDTFIFGSSCENLPNILLEAMASSLPIVSSNLGPMPEVLGKSAVYFNPESVPSIVNALHKILQDEILRKSLAMSSWEIAQQYSWENCAKSTFDFIYNVANKKKQ